MGTAGEARHLVCGHGGVFYSCHVRPPDVSRARYHAGHRLQLSGGLGIGCPSRPAQPGRDVGGGGTETLLGPSRRDLRVGLLLLLYLPDMVFDVRYPLR